MGKRGPAPTPTPILEARGSWRAKGREGEASFGKGVPECPAWMPAEGRSEWDRLTEQLAAAGLLQQVDWNLLSAYCEVWSDYVRIVKATKGMSVIRCIALGLLAAKRKAVADLHRLAQQFGFSPASRTRVQGATGGEGEGDTRSQKFFGVVG